MKFICLGYFDEKKFDAMSESEQRAFVDECFSYDDELRRKGQWVAKGEALQGSRNAVTLRWNNGRVMVTDGPYAETKEQLGGFGLIEATDLKQAIELMTRHPSLKSGIVEIRPAADLAGMVRESAQRRSGKS